MSDKQFDVVVIGGGPGGYVAAIRAAQLGLKTACVDARGPLGGTCLNVGCIPSKALLHSSHYFEMAAHDFAGHGIRTGKLGLDLPAMMARKEKVVKDLTGGIAYLFKKNKVTHFHGVGRIAAKDTVVVTLAGKKGETTLKASNVVIATGSVSAPLPGVEIDEKRIVSSTGALALPKVPKRLAVIGAGVIGLELGSVWRRLGAEVIVLEYLDRILMPMDLGLAKEAQKILKKQGIDFKLGVKVTDAKVAKDKVELAFAPAKGGRPETLAADVVLVAIGRKPYTEGLGLEEAQVARDKQGRVEIDDHFRTNVKGVYALGDVVRGPMLAHKAEDEGIAVAEIIAGQAGHVNYDAIPAVVYTWPEIAAVGKTEEELKAAGVPYNTGQFPFQANSRGRANADTDGFVKILADKKTDRVQGVHIVGPVAGELIAEAALAIEFGASAEDIARTCHAHPGFGEAVKEAALAVAGRPIHF
ncbi:MAG: dihydrolipoyl dehydrogenase [Pseudomonadota bacterium]